MDGYGTYSYENGDTYEGDFKMGKMHGYGSYVFDNGNEYHGEWIEDSMEGEGIYAASNGNYYEGTFNDGEVSMSRLCRYVRSGIFQGDGGKAPNYLVTIYTSNSAYEDYIDNKQR